jgi:uncharacterized protein (TIGR03437 family)
MDSPLVTSGTDTMVEIRGFDTNFVSGRTNIGFGSSDIFVRRVWVVGPGRLLANISVSPTAPTVSSVSVVTGLQMVTLPTALQLQAANTGQASLRTPIVNEVTSMVGVPVGGTALINTTGLPQNLGGWILTIGGQQTGFTMGANGQIRAAVPGSLLPGPAVVQLVSPGGPSVPPVLMQVDPPPPAITGAVNTAGVSIDGSHPVKSGDTVTLAVAGLADSNNVLPAASSVRVNIGGINIVAAAVNPGSGTPGACLVQFVVPANLSNGAQQVSVGVDTRVSAVYSIAVQN